MSDSALATPVEALAELIARSPTFQGWVGAANHLEALARVYLIDEAAPVRPFAVVYEVRERATQLSTGPFGSAVLGFALEGGIVEATHAEAYLYFAGLAGEIADEVLALQHQVDGSLLVRGIRQREAAWRSDPAREEEAFYTIAFDVDVGPEI